MRLSAWQSPPVGSPDSWQATTPTLGPLPGTRASADASSHQSIVVARWLSLSCRASASRGMVSARLRWGVSRTSRTASCSGARFPRHVPCVAQECVALEWGPFAAWSSRGSAGRGQRSTRACATGAAPPAMGVSVARTRDAVKGEAGVDSKQTRVVVLLHGLARSSGCMRGIAATLEEHLALHGLSGPGDRWVVLNIGYPTRSGSLEALVGQAADTVRRECRDRGVDIAGAEWFAVTHSLGGLLARHLPSALGVPFTRIAMLSPPNQGSTLARRLVRGVPLVSPAFRALFGPVADDLARGASTDGTPWPVPDAAVGVVMGTRHLSLAHPVSWLAAAGRLLGPGPSDGTVALAEMALGEVRGTYGGQGARVWGWPGYEGPRGVEVEAAAVPASHTFLMYNQEAQLLAARFVAHGTFRGAGHAPVLPATPDESRSSGGAGGVSGNDDDERSPGMVAVAVDGAGAAASGFPRPPLPHALRVGAHALRAGGVVAVPTDTLYGLACAATSKEGILRLYRIKGRDGGKPVAVCVGDVAQVAECGEADHLPQGLLESLLPGPVTVVLRRRSSAPLSPCLNPGVPTIGIRVPNCPFIVALCRAYGGPVALSSANRSGARSALEVTEFEELWPQLSAVFDGGPIASGRAGSTLVDLTREGLYEILRDGDAKEMVEGVMGRFGWTRCSD